MEFYSGNPPLKSPYFTGIFPVLPVTAGLTFYGTSLNKETRRFISLFLEIASTIADKEGDNDWGKAGLF